jgi:predicted dienelactone hydrolase
MWLGHHLASRGYIVAALSHHGNTGAEPRMSPQGFLLYWERARDLSVALDSLLTDTLFASRIDTTRIGAAGFSLGGYTVLAAAGARFDPDRYDAFCASSERDFTCEPQLEFPEAPAQFAELRKTDRLVRESLARARRSYRDPRIKAVLAIAPALGGGFDAEDVHDIAVPVRIVVGSADSITPPATNAARYASLIRGAELTIFREAAGHYTFLALCTERGKSILALCRDAPGVDRALMHERVRAIALEHFGKSLHSR